MKYPQKYSRPKLENLAATTDVAWGQCNAPGSAAGAETCGGGGTAGNCILIGQTPAECTTGATFGS